ncbi:MAG: S41 family peptidase [Acidobacteria bacterium]|nr:S41 family peptidase [Acidobacteriota bacterium]
MLQKGKALVFFLSALVVSYGLLAAFYGRVVARDEAYKELAVFMDALNKINKDYVEAPDMTKVQEGAMHGLMAALDPYSGYFTKAQFEVIQKRLAAGTAGPGFVLSKRADVLFIVSLQKDGPAESAGLRQGDYLVAIDGVGVEDKSILEAESLLRGAPGTKVKVSVFRSARTKPLEIEITRRAESPAAPASQMIGEGIGLLEVPSLAGSAAEQVRLKLKTLVSAGAQKIILDLRDSADGDPDTGAEVANLFLREGLIYYCQNRNGERTREVRASGDRFVTDLPLVLLINESSASAAEIVAGALKDNGRAVIIGEKSFGMGSIQERITLKSGAVLVLSTAKVYTPAGKMIQDEAVRHTGIRPDVEVPDDDLQQDLVVQTMYDTQEDQVKYRQLREKIRKVQLDRALELLAKGVLPEKKAA